MVSSRHEFEKIDSQQETGMRTSLSSQPSSSLSSPLSSAPSRLAEDVGEMAQKAMEAWQNALGSTKSDLNRQELLPGRANTASETRTAVSPRSPGVSTGDGTTQSRNWLAAPDERQYRTPLPTQKESRLSDASSPKAEHSLASGGDLAQPAQHSTTLNSALSRTTDRMSRNSQSINSDAFNQQAVTYSDDCLRIIAKDSIQLSVRDAPKWQTGVETRQLPPLPSIGMQFPPIGRNSISRQPEQQPLQGSLNSFPSTFSVLTSDEVQRNQTSNRGGRRRGKKPPDSLGAHGRVEDRPTSQTIASGDVQPEFLATRQEARSDDGQPRASPEFTKLQPSIRRPLSAASNMPQVYHSVQLRGSATPPLSSTAPHATFQPPPVTFTIDNRAESPLQNSEIQPFIESFMQNTAVILPFTASDKEPSSHPINVIMWQGLNELYRWYGQLLHVQEIGPLMFELIDVHWQEERSFVVPEGNLNYFRTMKQYVWDLYWFAVNVNKGPTVFRVVVTRFSPQNLRAHKKPDIQRNSVDSKPSSSPARRLGSDQQSHVIVESRPGPLFPHQQPPVRPPTATVPQSRPFSSHRKSLEDVPTTAQKSRSQRDSFTSIQPPIDDNGSNRRQSLPASSPQMGHVRTVRDQAMLRERAHAYVSDYIQSEIVLTHSQLVDRQDLELFNQESTVLDKLPYKTGAEVCGVVVDKRSGKGMVAVTGKGYITLNVKTGPDEPGDRYQEVTIQPKQTCMLHGEAVVLFYKRRQEALDPASQIRTRSESRGPSQSSATSEVDIIIRLQIDGNGKYSSPFDKSVLRPRITTTEFFSFFANQSGHCAPVGPPYLRFTFKDAMPAPTSTEIARGNEDHFNYMRKDIKAQCEKAKKFIVDLKEFVILVTVPGWRTTGADEEEEW